MTLETVRNLSRCITPTRLWNLARVFVSYKLSTSFHRSIVWGMPYTLTIEPTNICNLQCPECPSGNGEMTRPAGSMSLEDYRTIVDQVARETFYLQLFFQGEPFIHRHLIDMIAHARSRHMYVSVSTNAHFIDRETARRLMDTGVDRLIISLDGVTDETYRDYRVGGKLSKVLEALGFLDQAKKVKNGSTEIVLQFLVTKQNEHEIPRLRKLAKLHRAGVSLKTIQVYSPESAAQFLPVQERYRRYRMINGELVTKNRMKNRCVRLWERSVITWDGVVVPCCFDKNAQYPLGRLNGVSFADVWRSSPYENFRKRILRDRRGVEMCRNCTEGLKVYR